KPGGNLSTRLARRMAVDRADAARAVRRAWRTSWVIAHGRLRPLRADGRLGAMNQIRVIAPGMESSIQDLGRFGWAHFGVSASGAADALALRAGNLLVGNAENAAGVEMTLVGGAFEFESQATIALTGSDFGAGLPLWTPIRLAAGATVRC